MPQDDRDKPDVEFSCDWCLGNFYLPGAKKTDKPISGMNPSRRFFPQLVVCDKCDKAIRRG